MRPETVTPGVAAVPTSARRGHDQSYGAAPREPNGIRSLRKFDGHSAARYNGTAKELAKELGLIQPMSPGKSVGQESDGRFDLLWRL